MKRVSKRVIRILSAIMTVLLLISSLNFPSYAKEEEDDLGVTYQVGDFVQFGKYEQDGDSSNGKEDIEWQILKVESNRVLVVSKYALDCKPYNTELTDVTWETCTLRNWLNNDFKNAAFSISEQKKIPTVTITTKENNNYNNTNDQIFCLSFREIGLLGNGSWYNIYGFNQKCICSPTIYTIQKGASKHTINEYEYNSYLEGYGYTRDVIGRIGCRWWLREPGYNNSQVYVVDETGWVGGISQKNSPRFDVNYNDVSVRPALYISFINPKGIFLNQSTVDMIIGDEFTLTATLTPEDVTEDEISWTSSNPKVATVSDGEIKAISEGTTTIKATTVNDLTATCEITVKKAPDDIFADIKVDTWQYKAAKAIYEKGYMTGTGKDGDKIIFSPNTDMNRTMFVQALYSMDGKPEVSYVQKFSDVKESAWYAKAVTWASNSGVVAGNPDGTFGINGKATREQMALMLYQYAKYKKYDVSVSTSTNLNGFTDSKRVSNWAYEAVKWAVERGIISGKGNAESGYRIAPTEKATRIECAAMLNKFSEVYADAPKIGEEDLEEPLALPEEDIEDLPVPADETEDVIIDEEEDDEDDPSKNEADMNEEEINSEEDSEVD